MFVPEKMEQLHFVFSDRDVDRVCEAVIREGTFQVVDTIEVADWAGGLAQGGSGEETPEQRTVRLRVESVLHTLEIPEKFSDVKPASENEEALDERLSDIEKRIATLTGKRDAAALELDRVESLKTRIQEIPDILFRLRGRKGYSYLTAETGKVSEKNLPLLQRGLEPMPHLFVPVRTAGGTATVIVFALKRDAERLSAALIEASFQPIDVDDEAFSGQAPADLDRQIAEQRGILDSVNAELRSMADESNGFIRSLLYRIRRENLKHTILKYFRKTERTYVLSGWVPAVSRDSLVREIRRATENRCAVQGLSAEAIPEVRNGKMQVPVRLKNPTIFKPFEMLTGMYGTPAYRSIDPTPLLGISFLAMFGLMFGDVGHGLVLALIGAFMCFSKKLSGMKQIGLLLLLAGSSSMVFGFLFGSIFGFEETLPTLWLKPMHSISRLFSSAIYFGIGLIFVSILVNVINGFRQKNYLGALFDKAGILAAIFYWCGIFAAIRVLSAGSIPGVVIVLLLASLVLLFLREPIIHLAEGKKHLFPEGLATGVIGGFVEILEIFLGFLANSVSFIRVAAFGLAHAGLFMAVFALSKAMGGGAGSVAIQIFGNIGIIVLEGMVVTIQVVRLEFYEFFSRFFQQGEKAYQPVGMEVK